MHHKYILIAKIVFIFTFLVILAGGVVRTTQSGMGCPDWPKCFGRWIPPTKESELPINYKEIYAFKYVDTSFNAFHTWTEYVNRLLGALLGLFMLIQAISFSSFLKKNRLLFVLALFQLLLTGFQGWLGAKVVEANLMPVKVTTHMLFAFASLAISLIILQRLKSESFTSKANQLNKWMLVALLLTIIQVLIGTQVRQQIDDISLGLNFKSRDLWINKLNFIFYVHRSFSIVIVLINVYIFWQLKKALAKELRLSQLIMLLIGVEIVLGMVLSYANMPAAFQPLHLLLSTAMFAAQFALYLRLRYN